MRYNLLFLVIGLLFIAGISCGQTNDPLEPGENSSWKLRRDKYGIKVWTRSVEGKGIIEYLAKTILETELSKLTDLLRDVENYPSWTANCESAFIYKVLSDSSFIEYLTTKVPWPMDDRDVVMEAIVARETEDYFELRLNSTPEAVPLSDKHVRIEISKGSWKFKKLDDKRVEVIHQFMSDPGGNIPKGIVNMFIVSGPYKTLLNLHKLCAE